MVIEIVATETEGFWDDKTPCWEMCHCPEEIRNDCPATKYATSPCWEIEGTYLKLSDDGKRGDDVRICKVCRVYKKYGQGKPIETKLLNKGVDSYLRNLKTKSRNYGNVDRAKSEKEGAVI